MSHKNFLNVLSMEELTTRLTGFPPLESLTGNAALSLCALCPDDVAAVGHVLAQDVVSPENLPPADRSGMDGYAVRAVDLFGASESNPVWLDRVGTISIDTPPDFGIQSGQCAAIVTGGFLPQGADAVIMVEHTSEFGAGVIEMRRSVAPGEYVLRKGDDAEAGKTALTAGTFLRPQEIGLLAGLGVTRVPVFRRPRVTVLSTGDELIPPDHRPSPGQIRDVNGPALTAMLRRGGYEAQSGGIIPDSLEALSGTLKNALRSDRKPDVIFLSGGSSVGVRDFTLEALASLDDADIFCQGVALSPGKPLIVARCGSSFIWGLPGQVTSAQIVMLVLGLPFLRHLSGCAGAFVQKRWPSRPALLTRNTASRQGREDYVRVRLEPPSEPGMPLRAVPVPGLSGLLRTLLDSDGVIRIPASLEGLEAGTPVDVLLFGENEGR